MSGLLVKSTLIMRDNLEELNTLGLGRHPRPARRRRAHPPLRRARPARDLRGTPVLRSRRVRGPVHPRLADGDEAHGRVGSRVRSRAHRAGPAREVAAPTRRSSSPPGQPSVETDNKVFVPPFLGIAGRQGTLPRRHRRLRQRDRALPQPVAVPAGEARRRNTRDRRRVQGPHPRAVPPAARCRQGVGGPRPPGRVRILPGQRRRRRPRDLDRRVAYGRGGPIPLPPPAGRPVPVHRRLLPSGRRRARSTTPPSTSSRWVPPSARRRRGCSPPTSTSST